jgi:hypothetical protein
MAWHGMGSPDHPVTIFFFLFLLRSHCFDFTKVADFCWKEHITLKIYVFPSFFFLKEHFTK